MSVAGSIDVLDLNFIKLMAAPTSYLSVDAKVINDCNIKKVKMNAVELAFFSGCTSLNDPACVSNKYSASV